MNFEKPTNINLFVPGDKSSPKGTPGVPGRITHAQMMAWLDKADIDNHTRKELKKIVKRYPANTMSHFYENLHVHIQRIQAEKSRNDRGKEEKQDS